MKMISFAFSCVWAALVCLPTMVSAYSDINYEFQTYNYPDDTFTQLLGINDKDKIAGYHGMNINKGFTLKLSDGKFKNENFPNSAQTQVIAINNKGITGGFYIDDAGATHGFLAKDSQFRTVDFPNTFFNEILGVNNHGFAVGYWQDLTTLNDFPYIYVEHSGVFLPLSIPGAVSAQATGINDSEVVCGFYVDAGGINHGFILDKKGVTSFDFPNSTFTQALGLNNKGFVVGAYMDIAGATHGFLYRNGNFQSVDDPNGIGTTIVNGINDSADIVGFYVGLNGNTDGFVGKPIEN